MWIKVLSLNDGVVNKEFVNSMVAYNEIVDNNNDNGLNYSKFLNKIFSIKGNTLHDSINTENMVNIESVSNFNCSSSNTSIIIYNFYQ